MGLRIIKFGCNLVILGMALIVLSCCMLSTAHAKEPPTAIVKASPPVAMVWVPILPTAKPVVSATPIVQSKTIGSSDWSSVTITKPIPRTTISYRQPIGHTHTCPQCGDVWDHQKNPGHTCQQCGSQSWIQDRNSRLIPIRTTYNVQPSTIVQPSTSYTPQYTLPLIQSNCPGGNCPLPTRYR